MGERERVPYRWRLDYCDAVRRAHEAGLAGDAAQAHVREQMAAAGWRPWVIVKADEWFRSWMRATAKTLRSVAPMRTDLMRAYRVGVLGHGEALPAADGTPQPHKFLVLGSSDRLEEARFLAEVLWCLHGPVYLGDRGAMVVVRWNAAPPDLTAWPDPANLPRWCPWGGPVLSYGVLGLVENLMPLEDTVRKDKDDLGRKPVADELGKALPAPAGDLSDAQQRHDEERKPDKPATPPVA